MIPQVIRDYIVYLFISLILGLSSCQENIKPSQTNLIFEGFEKYSLIDGFTLVQKKDQSGDIIEQGTIKNNQKHGQWIIFENNRIKKIENFILGIYNGTLLSYNRNGQIESRSDYIDGKLDGKFISYNFGRKMRELTYKQNILDGPFEEYYERGMIRKRGNFKNGKQDGKLFFYNEEGLPTMEYTYKDGVKLEGGIISNKNNPN